MAFSRDQKDGINRRSSQRSRKPNWQKGQSPVRHVDTEETIAVQYIKSKKDRDDLEVKFISKEIGRGVFVKRTFLAGEFLMEYDGELISGTEGLRRDKVYPEEYGSFIYFFRFNNKRMCLDGTFSKRKGRFVNDGIGKEQNAKMKMLKIDGRPYLVIFALRDINTGEEIRYDYGVPDLPWRNKKSKKSSKSKDEQVGEPSEDLIQFGDSISEEASSLLPTTPPPQMSLWDKGGEIDKVKEAKEELLIPTKAPEREAKMPSAKVEKDTEKEQFEEEEIEESSYEDRERSSIKPDLLQTRPLADALQFQPLESYETSMEASRTDDVQKDKIKERVKECFVKLKRLSQKKIEEFGTQLPEELTEKEDKQISTPDQDLDDSLTEKDNTIQPKNGRKDENDDQKKNVLVVMTCTALCPTDLESVKKLLEMTKDTSTHIKFLSTFTSDVTHVIVKTEPEGSRICARTLKYFQGVVHKCWVLDVQWVFESLAAGHLLPEERYEIIGDDIVSNCHNGPCLSRTSNVGLFQGYTVLLYGFDEDGSLPLGQVQDLIESSGGRVEMNSMTLEENILCILAYDTDQLELIPQETRKTLSGKKCISYHWLLDSITQFKIPPLNDYYIDVNTDFTQGSPESLTPDSPVICYSRHLGADHPIIYSSDNEDNNDFECQVATDSARLEETLESGSEQNVVITPQDKVTSVNEVDIEKTKQNLLGKFTEFLTEDVLKKYLTEGKDTVEKCFISFLHRNESQNKEQRNDLEKQDHKPESPAISSEDNSDTEISDANTVQQKSSKGTKGTVKNNQKASSRRKRPCPFCGKFYGSLTKHMKSKKHKNEPEVIAAMKLDKQERDNAFTLLRRKGYHQKNIERIKEAEGDDYILISERNRGDTKKYFMCSFCNGTFAEASMTKHKRSCIVTEGTTISPISVPIILVTNDDQKLFRDNVLSNFRDDEVGNICRRDELIREFGQHNYKKAFSRKDKQLQVKQRVMALMRMLGKLFVYFKDIAERNNAVVSSVEDIFDRTNFNILEAALEEISVTEDGSLKAGLKKNLGFLIKNVLEYLKGAKMIQKKDDEVDELEKFTKLLDFKWTSIFDAAEYKCQRSKQEKLRRPARLPKEEDIKAVRDVTLKEIKRLIADEFNLLSGTDYCRLRDLVCSRLTLFNARRGGEPSRLTLKNWEEAKQEVWLNKNYKSNDPLEQMLLCRFKLTYQSGKHVSHLVPDLIPEDCWVALDRLSDPGVRHAAGVNKKNQYLFPSTANSDRHVIGWQCCDRACKITGLKETITATDMRHRAATIYAGLDVSENDREAFYRHMGHSADINRNVYQCPFGLKEMVTVGGFLLNIDGTVLQDRVISQEDEDQFEDAVKNLSSPDQSAAVATTSGKSDNQEVSNAETEFNLQAFLQPLVDENVMIRATSGRALIDEEDVEVSVQELTPHSFVLCDPAVQRMAKPYFTDDGWLCVQNTLKILKEHVSSVNKEVTQKAKVKTNKRKFLSEEISQKIEEVCPKRKRLSTDISQKIEVEATEENSDSEGVSQKTESEDVKQKCHSKEREYYVWKKEDAEAVASYFKQQIEDTSYLDAKGSLPGIKIIKEFLRLHPILEDVTDEKEKVWKTKTKIMNNRNIFRRKYKKRIEKHLF